MEVSKWFNQFAKSTAQMSGRPTTFALAMMVVLAWGISGPLFGYSDTWQLVINTGTTVVTFLMVFLIQSTQNRDTAALQLKLDELIRVTKGAHTALLDLEELTEDELDTLRANYESLAETGRAQLRSGGTDDGCPEVNILGRHKRGATAIQ